MCIQTTSQGGFDWMRIKSMRINVNATDPDRMCIRCTSMCPCESAFTGIQLSSNGSVWFFYTLLQEISLLKGMLVINRVLVCLELLTFIVPESERLNYQVAFRSVCTNTEQTLQKNCPPAKGVLPATHDESYGCIHQVCCWKYMV